ncbi:MAG: choice-of-anchor Q domain-containing protein [Pseudobdellovibrionaceae bacterium]
MTKRWVIFSATLFGLLPFMYNACTSKLSDIVLISKGTEITNPMAPASNKMALALCTVIQRCHQTVKSDDCYAGVMKSQGIGAPLGLSSNFTTLANISQAEQSGLLISNNSSGNTCANAIDSLACDDPRVVAAYNSSANAPFSGAPNMVSGSSCGGVFASLAQYTCPNKVFLRGTANSADAPVAAASGMTYTVAPSLPPGLTMDSSTGAISGTPTTVVPTATYTITATSTQGALTATVSIETADGFLVNDLGDADDANAGDGNCATSSGTCTLRAALSEVNQSNTSAINIVLPQGTVLLSTPLTINKSVTLYGGCSTPTVLDGQGTTALFLVAQSNLQVSMRDLKFQNGNGSSTSSGAINGGFNDGLIFNGSHLTFFNNRSTTGSTGGAVSWGGASSQFNCDDCIFDSNQSSDQAGALLLSGQNNSINRSLFTNNSGVTGAISDNSSQGSLIVNSTFFANRATLGSGAVWVNTAAANTYFVNATFVNNHTESGYAGALDGGGKIHLTNSILLNNTGGIGDCDRATVSHGGNLSTASATHCELNQPTDLIGVAILGPLQNNGGYSSTLALLPGSPGVDQGLGDTCPAVDQRGLPRPAKNACDVGAFEAQ